jgi:cholesterol transport system auxiliary component
MRYPFSAPGLLAAAACLLSACVSVLPDAGPPPAIYRLSDFTTTTAPPKFGTAVVKVALPTSPRALASNRIAALESGGELVFISGARWEAPTPRLLQNAALVQLSAEPSIRAAVRPEDGVVESAELRLNIERYEFERTNRTVHASVYATLVSAQDREVLGAARFTRSAEAETESTRAVITAFDQASNQLMDDVGSWAGELVAIEELGRRG